MILQMLPFQQLNRTSIFQLFSMNSYRNEKEYERLKQLVHYVVETCNHGEK